jgi:mannose-6-phosphate isomerase-like protein (cupin superfamily)
MPEAINLLAAAERLEEFWSPAILAQVNDQHVKVARVRGQFTWHSHPDEDELFLVLKGRLRIQFEDGETLLGPGEFCVVPRGVRHNPVADEECLVALVETVTTLHTGDVHVEGLTRSVDDQLRRGEAITTAGHAAP